MDKKRYKKYFEITTPCQRLIKEVSQSSEGYFRGVGFFLPNGVNLNLWEFDNKIGFDILVNNQNRNQGYATQTLKFLTNLADKYKVILTADVEPFGATKGLNKSQLFKWYKSFGFVKNKYNTLERIPK
jgi:hypothetical protein